MDKLKEIVKNAPLEPGVYLMKNSGGRIIYVGKAKALRKRLSQYIGGAAGLEPKVRAMMDHVRDIEYIITDNEVEALVLELNMIKSEKPPYNIMLRDDKTYPFIKVTLNEEYPRVLKTRTVKRDGARYFGPYPSADYVNRIVALINDSFPIKKCPRKLSKTGQRPCLNYHIKKCLGPCRRNGDMEGYGDMVANILQIIEGRSDRLLKNLEMEMEDYAADLKFEKAAKVRDQLQAVAYIRENQKVVFKEKVDQDYVAMARENGKFCFVVFYIREGRLIGKDHYILENLLNRTSGEMLGAFLTQYYIRSAYIPREILTGEMPDEKEILEKWLSDKRRGKVRLMVPKRGDKHKLLKMAEHNASEILTKRVDREKAREMKGMLLNAKLQELLGMESPIRRIEAYDISNISGVYSVGSMVVFEDAEALKRAYRRFRIRSVDEPDDYKSMQEILYRRFQKGLREMEELENSGLEMEVGKFSDLPDLVLVDGGLGHVHAAEAVLKAFHLSIPVAGMKKDAKHATESLVYREETLQIKQDRDLLKFIAHIQDETHRFAIAYHKNLRGKSLRKSILDEIDGIGEKRKALLFNAFGSIDAIREADEDALAAVKGIDRRTAGAIVDFFKKKRTLPESMRMDD